MSHEVLDLLHFYRSAVGQSAFKIMISVLEKLWDTPPKQLTGVGYCDPFLDNYRLKDSNCLSLTPGFTGLYARSGIENYPTILVDETNLPLRKDSQKHMLCAHIIEHTAHPELLLKEIYNSLKPEGEVIFIVTNRHGRWARSDNTPFGSGRPYSWRQLNKLLQEVGFIVNDYHPALFIQPASSFTSRYYSRIIEIFGKICLPRYSGVHIIRALKRIYVPPMRKQKNELLDFIPELPNLMPKGKPIRENLKL